MSKTIKDHIDESDQVKTLIDHSNALLVKAREELVMIRESLECLRAYQHPKLVIASPGYRMKDVVGRGDRPFAPLDLIDAHVTRINALIGDRP